MNMAQAIAYSSGNKAQAHNDNGHLIIVQERYTGVGETWLHIWHIHKLETWESDLHLNRKPLQLKELYAIDENEKYWSAI